MINKMAFQSHNSIQSPNLKKAVPFAGYGTQATTQCDTFSASNNQKQAPVKFAGYREDSFFSEPEFHGDPYRILADEMESDPKFKETVKKWDKDIKKGHLPKACRILAQTVGAGGGAVVDTLLSTPSHASHMGTIGGAFVGGFAQEYMGNIIKVFKDEPEAVKEVELYKKASRRIGPNGDTAELSNDFKKYCRGEKRSSPAKSDTITWAHGFSSPSSKEQQHVKDALPALKGKGSKSRKLASKVRETIIPSYSGFLPNAHVREYQGGISDASNWREAISLLNIKDGVSKADAAIDHFYNKRDAIADYIEES